MYSQGGTGGGWSTPAPLLGGSDSTSVWHVTWTNTGNLGTSGTYVINYFCGGK
jgi:hypothetical protein